MNKRLQEHKSAGVNTIHLPFTLTEKQANRLLQAVGGGHVVQNTIQMETKFSTSGSIRRAKPVADAKERKAEQEKERKRQAEQRERKRRVEAEKKRRLRREAAEKKSKATQNWTSAGPITVTKAPDRKRAIVGMYEIEERPPDQPPVYVQTNGRGTHGNVYLYVSTKGKWTFSNEAQKDNRGTACFARSVV